MTGNPAAVCLAALFASSAAPVQENPGSVENPPQGIGLFGLSGSLRGGYWSGSRSLDEREDLGTAALWLKAMPKLRENASLLLEGWVANKNYSGDKSPALLREAHLDLTLGPADIRLGKQLIIWGRADRLNPTDNLTPRNYTALMPEDDDQRFGTIAAQLSYHFDSIWLTGIWLPKFTPSTVPIHKAPGLGFTEQIPDSSRQWAVKLEQTSRAVDWSVSYFDGFDLIPDLGVGTVGPAQVNVLLRHFRTRVIGADAATALGHFGVHAEAAYTFTENPQGLDPLIPRPFFYAVLGIDRTFFEYLNVNVQYYQRRIDHFSDPNAISDPLLRAVAVQNAIWHNQLDASQHGVTVRISDKWFHEMLEAELAAIYDFTRRDYAVRPKIIYALSDHWKATLGADLFRGQAQSYYGNLRDNSLWFVELRYVF
jgi:hypothetical protein